MTDEHLRERVAELNPVKDVAADPQAEERVLQLLRDAPAPDGRRPRTRWRLGLAAAACVAGAALALSLTLGRGGGDALAQARAAVEVAPGQILHTSMVVERSAPGRPLTRASEEDWMRDTQSGLAWRSIQTPLVPAGRTVETEVGDGTAALYDPASDTLYQPQHVVALGQDVSNVDLQDQLAAGSAHFVGTSTRDGVSVDRIDTGSCTYYSRHGTFTPVEISCTDAGGAVTDIRYSTYEVLDPTPANLQLFDLRAQHPGATVVTDAEAYMEAFRRLHP
jgi:hypothetical protein